MPSFGGTGSDRDSSDLSPFSDRVIDDDGAEPRDWELMTGARVGGGDPAVELWSSGGEVARSDAAEWTNSLLIKCASVRFGGAASDRVSESSCLSEGVVAANGAEPVESGRLTDAVVGAAARDGDRVSEWSSLGAVVMGTDDAERCNSRLIKRATGRFGGGLSDRLSDLSFSGIGGSGAGAVGGNVPASGSGARSEARGA
jgi:hypothetical protein